MDRLLEESQREGVAESYQIQLASFLKTKSVQNALAENYLGLSKYIRKNPYGDMA